MISIIICSITPSKYSAIRRNLRALLGDEPHEFIGIHDARSLAEGYIRGIRQSRGEILIFCHDDIEILATDFRQRLLAGLERFDLVGIAGSTKFAGPKWVDAGPPHVFGQIVQAVPEENCFEVTIWATPARYIPGIRLLDGVFLAGRRDVFESVQFDEETFTGFHFYDLDFTLRASAAGYRLAVCNDLMILHASKGNFGQEWKKYAGIFMQKHGDSVQATPPAEKWSAWCAMRVRIGSKQAATRYLQSPYWED